MSLNARQRAFVEHFGTSGNATAAATAAGYSPKTAGAIGCRLLKNVKVAAALAAQEEPRHAAAISTKAERLAFLSEVMRDESRPDSSRLEAVKIMSRICGDARPQLDLHVLDAWQVQTYGPEE